MGLVVESSMSVGAMFGPAWRRPDDSAGTGGWRVFNGFPLLSMVLPFVPHGSRSTKDLFTTRAAARLLRRVAVALPLVASAQCQDTGFLWFLEFVSEA